MRKKSAITHLVLLILLSIGALPAFAQTEEPTELISQDLTFADLGYGTRNLSEAQVERTFSLHLPENLVLEPEGNYVELVLSHVPPVPDQLSTISVKFNAVYLAVITLDEDNAEPTAFRFDLAGDLFVPGRNKLEVELDTGQRCGVRGATVEVNVLDSSLFHLEHQLVPYTPDLARYPLPFYEHAFNTQTVYFVLPNDPSATDLSAAATVSAGLGQYSDGQVSVSAILARQLTPQIRNQHHLIVIGTKGSNRVLDRLDLPLRLSSSTLEEHQGVIEELISPWNPLKMILVVSGLSDQGLVKASSALNRETHFLGMRGPVSIVQDVKAPPEPENEPRAIDYSLTALGHQDEIICGTMPDTLEYSFYMPLSWNMAEEPLFVLSFSHSDILDPQLSSLDVNLNGTPLASTRLDENNAHDGLMEIKLPPRKIQSGRNRLRVSVEMNMPNEDKCLFLNNCQIWTAIHNNSYLHLPFTDQELEPRLSHFPYPFIQRPDLDDIVLVLPDELQTPELDGMLRLAMVLGTSTYGDHVALEVMRASQVTESIKAEKHLIVFGKPTANTLIQALNQWLPQPFEAGTNLLQNKIDSVVFAPDPERDAGLLQELISPWNPNKTVLVLTGTTDEGATLAYNTLLYRSDDLAGNVAVVEDLEGEIYSLETRPLAPTSETTALEKVNTNSTLLSRLAERWW